MKKPVLTEMLRDPELGGGTRFTVHRTRLTYSHGAPIRETLLLTAVGNIQPDGFSTLSQQPGQDAAEQQIRIYTETLLSSGTPEGQAPDEILYRGCRWRVTEVRDWADWGYCVAHATRMKEGGRCDARR